MRVCGRGGCLCGVGVCGCGVCVWVCIYEIKPPRVYILDQPLLGDGSIKKKSGNGPSINSYRLLLKTVNGSKNVFR